MNSAYLDAILKRRSIYALTAENSIPDADLAEMIGLAVKNLPTAYNMQSSRAVLLLGENHAALWGIVLQVLRARSKDAQRFAQTEKKIATFAAGHGSVLFFDDTAVTEQYKADNPNYAQNFDGWALQQNGMLQISVWCLLAEQGMGASLQHYNPIIDDEVHAKWKLPQSWRLLAQMPFGRPASPAGEKLFVALDQRFKVFD